MKICSLQELYSILPDEERILVDVLRQFTWDNLPTGFKEKISYNVPYFHRKRGICIIWPSSVPRGGIESGVLFGFWYGNQLRDSHNYLESGTNKRIFYKIFQSVEDVDFDKLKSLIHEAVLIDQSRS